MNKDGFLLTSGPFETTKRGTTIKEGAHLVSPSRTEERRADECACFRILKYTKNTTLTVSVCCGGAWGE